jgi:hypothetical protein
MIHEPTTSPTPMLTLESSYAALKEAKRIKKIAADAIKQAKLNDDALTTASDAKKQSAFEYKAELEQFKGKHAPLFEAEDEAKTGVKDAQLALNETAEVALGRGEQLSFLTPEGEVSFEITAKPVLERMLRPEEKVAVDEALSAGLADLAAGRVRHLS